MDELIQNTTTKSATDQPSASKQPPIVAQQIVEEHPSVDAAKPQVATANEPATSLQNQEETFLQKNKTMIFGGVVGLIVITVVVGIGLSVRNTSKLEGMIMKMQEQTKTTTAPTTSTAIAPETSEITNTIPRK